MLDSDREHEEQTVKLADVITEGVTVIAFGCMPPAKCFEILIGVFIHIQSLILYLQISADLVCALQMLKQSGQKKNPTCLMPKSWDFRFY